MVPYFVSIKPDLYIFFLFTNRNLSEYFLVKDIIPYFLGLFFSMDIPVN